MIFKSVLKGVAIVLVLSVLVAYGVATMQETDKHSPEQNKSPNTAHLTGRVFTKSDVATIPDTPFSNGLVVVIPSEKWGALLHRAGITPGPKRRTQFSMNKDLFSDHVVVSAALKNDGSYSIYLDAGSYVLCVGKRGESGKEAGTMPVFVYGCLDLVVQAGGERVIDVFFGIAGVTSSGGRQ